MQRTRSAGLDRWSAVRFLVILAVFGAAVGALLALKSVLGETGLSLPAKAQDFVTLVLSIVVEAMPFVVLGAMMSAVIRLYPLSERIIGRLPRQPVLRRLSISLFGTFLPVCECGNVPVARGLVMRGLTVGESITFLLSAPIVNPVTLLATVSAFRFVDPSVVWMRMIGAIVIANVVGALISLHKNQSSLLTEGFYDAVCEAGHSHDHPHAPGKGWSRWREGVVVFRDEVSLMLGVLCLGAAIAGLTQVFVPREVLSAVGGDPVLSILAMVALAFIVSICANVDAFFALAYAGTFTAGSIVAFLVFGPMVDIKMLAMMRTTYTTKLLAIVTLVVALSSVLIGLLVNYAL